MKRIGRVCCFLLLAAGWSLAQDNEVSFTIGRVFPTDQKLRVDTALPGCQIQGCTGLFTFSSTSVAFAFGYARRIGSTGPITAYVELPALRQPSHDLKITTDNPSFGLFRSGRADAFFLTPSVRIQFLAKKRISPWATGGFGFAHLSQDFSTSTHTKPAGQFGGGMDVRMLPHLAVRGEVRDFWTGALLESGALSTLTGATALTSHIQHIYAGGGVVVKF